jgi:hypothetical protein
MPNLELLKLPWEIQIALASGYAAYAVAYTGLHDRQRTVDVTFISLVFSLIATLVLWLMASEGLVISGIVAFVISLLAGIVWRQIGRPFVFSALKWADITWSDDEPSALASLSSNSRHPITQVAVQMDDGTWLRCDDVRKFSDAPFAPCVIGPGGDIALYLSHEDSPDGKSKEITSARSRDYGDRITYIPASRIKRITLRYKSNHLSMAAGEQVAQVVVEKQQPAA